jgi:hypothetical protein
MPQEIYTNNIELRGSLTQTGTDTVLPKYDNILSNVTSNSASWNSVYSNVNANSANAVSVYSSVNTASANWNSAYDNIGNGSSVYSNVNANSANWDSVYSNVNANSANAVSVYSSVNTASANWDSVYSNVNANSATYATRDYAYSTYLSLTGGTISGDLTINENVTITKNLSVFGETTYIETKISTASAVLIDTNTTEDALRIVQQGSGYAIRIDDSKPDSTPFVVDSTGKVGVGTTDITSEVTVAGSVSSNGTVYANALNFNTVTFAGTQSTATSISAINDFIPITIGGNTKYIRLYDIA